MKKIFITFLFLVNISHACGLCSVFTPETSASLTVNSDEKKIKTVDVVLKLTEEFTSQMKSLYDTNANQKLDSSELLKIQNIFNDYAKPKRYFLTISYDKVIRKKTFNKIKVETFQSYIQNDILHFKYSVILDYNLYKNYFLHINIEDDENFFLISLNKNAVYFENNRDVEKIVNDNSVIFSINSLPVIKKENEIKANEIKEISIKEEVKKETSILSIFTKKIKSYLVSIKNGDYFALASLLLISFVYGVIHAIGPGHGKSLAFSYFVSNKSSFSKAFVISQASAFIHIIGAFILVVISVFILKSVLNNFVNDSVVILTKVSAVMIVLLSLYILYNKFKNKKCCCSSCNTETTPVFTVKNPEHNTLKTKSASIKKQDLYFVLTAGLIPCPGTVVLFIYAFILKTYLAVFLASIFISLGMGLVIFLSAFVGVGMKKITKNSHKITNILEIIAPLCMLLLGLLLYMNANLI